ncbi:MAG: prepilin-type N-terminal cleavage/methylation domain-containing protein [Candidatus Krumholzibacteria bacterium]|nr:prepilin-type N-terminal cleavage/methylation domain-containing protein [Candidatus Krumholzibacteria bacterium]
MTRHTHTQATDAGFSLIELMVVLVILTVGLLPLALVQTRAQQDVFESGQFTEAVQVAHLQMESAKSLGFGNAASDSGLVDGLYLWNRRVQPVAGQTGLDQITVTVAWTEKDNARQIMVTDRVSFR